MTLPGSSPPGGCNRDGVNLRLLWPQWQGAGTSSVRELASEFPFDVARRGYAVGSAVLEAVLPPHDGPTVTVPVAMSDDGLAERDGVEAKAVILGQLARALAVIGQYDPARIATLGGECSVSVAPFAALARRYVSFSAAMPAIGSRNGRTCDPRRSSCTYTCCAATSPRRSAFGLWLTSGSRTCGDGGRTCSTRRSARSPWPRRTGCSRRSSTQR
jgi:hypothetical protein